MGSSKTLTLDDIRRINFGAPAAERDINQGLIDYFLVSGTYDRVCSGKKTVILGNRGIGKSAILKMLAVELRGAGRIVIELAPEDYSYEVLSHSLAKESEGSWYKQSTYTVAWKYLLTVLSMKKIIERDPSYVRRNGQAIFAYIRDTFKNKSMTFFDLLISYLKRIEGVKIGEVGVAFKAQELRKLYKLEEIYDLDKEFRVIVDKYPVHILVDELDRGWDRSEDAQSFVSGLFQAALKFNQEYRNLRVVISLRREIYENIPALFEDAQKFWDQFETIDWNEEELLEMISKRIALSLGITMNSDPNHVWNYVFAEVLDYRRTKSRNYIIDRTLYRPRQMIQFCTDIKEKIGRNHKLPINYDSISAIEFNYSSNSAKDIAAEYRFQYPGLDDIFESFRGKYFNLSRDELILHCEELILGEMNLDAKAKIWIENLEPEKLIKILWEVGFVKARAVGGIKGRQRSGSKYLGSYQIADLDLSVVPNFQVHHMFRTYLGLKEKK